MRAAKVSCGRGRPAQMRVAFAASWLRAATSITASLLLGAIALLAITMDVIVWLFRRGLGLPIRRQTT